MINPELEAEIYYLTEAEGGRKNNIGNGYRGQFYHDGKDWIAHQHFPDKQFYYLGETTRTQITTANTNFHIGKFWLGKTFEIREGAKVVGKGKITKILRADFQYWDYDKISNYLPTDCTPYDNENIQGFVYDFDYGLEAIEGIDRLTYDITLDNPKEMIKVYCHLKNPKIHLLTLINNICEVWRDNLAFEHHFYKCDGNSNDKGFHFELSFLTWHSMYLSGKIIVSS